MSGKRRRLSKKEYERLEREDAEREAKARSDSEDRQQKIRVLWGLKGARPQLKEQKLKKLMHSIRLTGGDALIDEVGELVELVALQDREIEYLTQFRDDLEGMRKHCPNELQNLINRVADKTWPALRDEMIKTGRIKPPKPKEMWEYKRVRPPGVGLIESEFGGAGEAEWRRSIPGVFSLHFQGFHYQPTCLDEIFAGRGVNMRRLQELFGVHRNRFPRNLPSIKNGRERSYNHRAVVKIMNALLSAKRKSRGRRLQTWPSDPKVRTRVLSGIKARIKSLSTPEQIKAEFLAVIHRHLPDSAEK
jgi:hypothetical protein